MKKKIFSFFALAFITIGGFAQVSIIPEPVQTVINKGTFILPQKLQLFAPAALQKEAQLLQSHITVGTGVQFETAKDEQTANILLRLNASANTELGNEGYNLQINPTQISISGNTPIGIFYGIQSLMQLFPAQIEAKNPNASSSWSLPCVELTDYPRFSYRGLMLDVARHFFTKQEVKDFIDQMVKYKYNKLHWHLTDDEGWRIEIKSYPNLTAKGAWNVKKVGYFGDFKAPKADEPRNYGGFYTQEDIKEIVAYADERHVAIMPEIDVPGHSLAAIASYPELSCTPGADKYVVRSGEKIMDWHGDGTFTALVDNALCPANEKVYEFLDNVFGEIAALFPYPYIHVGGDECAKNFWEKNPQIQALMKREKLKDVHAVQTYFEKRVAAIIQSKNKKMIGWDEILEGGLPNGAAIMSWRGEKPGIEASNQKHEVVMTPTSFCYLDYMQADPIIEPRIYASLRLSKTYQFDPVPAGANAAYIIGGQGNIWSEQLYNTRHLQYMVWPRALALAECLWSPLNKKNWNGFVKKVEASHARFDLAKVKYAPSMYDPIYTVKTNANGKLIVEMQTEVEGLNIHYTFDNSFPDQYYPKYDTPIEVPEEAVMLKVITYRGDAPVGRLNSMPVEELRKRVKK